MAAVASPTTVGVTVNGVELQVPPGELIVETVKRLGLEIPIFCYHPRMKPVGMCRMCLVEVGYKQQDGSVRMMPKPQAGCTLPASEGMVVITDSQKLHTDRKGVLEFLLINHPLDCPICDRGGECPLQNNTLFYGPSTSRFVELKRHLPKAYPLSKYVTLDLERCIQCGRCVRFTEEISGDAELAFRFRGAEMQPSTFELKDFQSKFSGNVIEICPVGALTNSIYRFRARPWDLETKPAICTMCSNGCNIWFDYRVNKMVRINGRTNDAVNEEWTCDRGKFGHEWYNDDSRQTRVLVRKGTTLEESDWSDAYEQITTAFGPDSAILAGPSLSNEALFLLRKLFARVDRDYRWTKHLPTAKESLKSVLGMSEVQTPIAALENAPSILVFSSSLAEELPIIFLRVRKAWYRNGAKVVVASDSPTDADSFAHLILRYKPGTGQALANGLLAAAVAEGRAQVPAATQEMLKGFSPEAVEAITGVPAATIREASLLVGAESVVLTSQAILNQGEAQGTLETLGGLAMTTGAAFNCYALGANTQGAAELGFQSGRNTREILEACASGQVKALWLSACDPFALYHDRDLVQRAIEAVPFLVVQSAIETEVTRYASIVLPMTAPAEQDGTYTSAERRVQRLSAILGPKGSAKPAWKVATELLLRSKGGAPYFNSGEIAKAIAREVPAFAGADSLPEEGLLLKA